MVHNFVIYSLLSITLWLQCDYSWISDSNNIDRLAVRLRIFVLICCVFVLCLILKFTFFKEHFNHLHKNWKLLYQIRSTLFSWGHCINKFLNWIWVFYECFRTFPNLQKPIVILFYIPSIFSHNVTKFSLPILWH